MNKNRYKQSRYNFKPKFDFKPNENHHDENEIPLSPEDFDFRDYDDTEYDRLEDK